MVTIGVPLLWHDFGFGLLLMVAVLVAAELLARHTEASAARRRAGSSVYDADIAADHVVLRTNFADWTGTFSKLEH